MAFTPLNALNAFLAVARKRGFTAAATELGISPSALSQAVRQLEERLGVPLLTRTSRSVALTDAGQRLLENAGPAVDQALERVGMTEFRHRQIGELSGGQKKRVFLARALAQGAAVILLDEPFTGVDVKTEEAIIALLRQMRDEGRVMLVSTHDLGSVPEFCDRVVLVKGTVLAHGPTAEVFTPQNLRLAFGGVLRHLVLGAGQIHDDDDPRELTMLSDDERPLVFYDGKARTPEAAPK